MKRLAVLFASLQLVPFVTIAGPLDLFVATSNDEVIAINSSTGATKGTFIPEGVLSEVRDIEFGPDSNLYVTQLFSGTRVFDGSSGAGLFRQELFWVRGLSIAIDRRGMLYAVAAGGSNKIERYDVYEDRLLNPGPDRGVYTRSLSNPFSITVADEGNVFFSHGPFRGPQEVVRIDYSDFTARPFPVSTFLDLTDIGPVRIGADEHTLVAYSRMTNTIYGFDVQTGMPLGPLIYEDNFVTDLKIGPDGYLYVAADGQPIRRYNARTGESVGEFGNFDGQARFLAFGPAITIPEPHSVCMLIIGCFISIATGGGSTLNRLINR